MSRMAIPMIATMRKRDPLGGDSSSSLGGLSSSTANSDLGACFGGAIGTAIGTTGGAASGGCSVGTPAA